jgi:membrane peptidoglycan carboxypeptidase
MRTRFRNVGTEPSGRAVTLLVVIALAGTVLAIGASAMVATVRPEVDEALAGVPFHRPRPPRQTTIVEDADGHVMNALRGAVNRTVIPFSQMPVCLREATIAVEDRNFYREGALSLSGIARATLRDVAARAFVQGGSTITGPYRGRSGRRCSRWTWRTTTRRTGSSPTT